MKGIRPAAALVAVMATLAMVPACAQTKDTILPATPEQMLGPYYPLQPEVLADHDLTHNGKAHGRPLSIVGRLQDTRGRPLSNILVEIWQTNAYGRYHHPHDNSQLPLDLGFRGYGRIKSDASGEYHFVTIWPAAYPGRTPHVHFRVSREQQEMLVTQMYLPGPHSRSNQRDSLFMAIDDPAQRARLVGIPLESNTDTLRFDIVIDAASLNAQTEGRQ